MALGLHALLSDKKYYSIGINRASKKTCMSVEYLRSTRLSNIFMCLFSDKINIFTFNGVEYIGLETRRIDYEHDKLLGINWVEDAIKAGKYD